MQLKQEIMTLLKLSKISFSQKKTFKEHAQKLKLASRGNKFNIFGCVKV